ncbi:putative flavin-binding monooxygenase [Aspergillus sergii]|uniref:Putative flavin-binding monooxygenase n=1 Tax=Aspergillus sergii TaxID=1034303 RepID=A0A5N6WYX4_9EURO|nr:putative flavin-binding monooxygenase [Aspergillus sergii]
MPFVHSNPNDVSVGHIPAYVYQATFESNPNWSEFYASSKEILQYWRDIVAKYGVRKYMQLNHKVVEARFNDAEAKWLVKIENGLSGDLINDTCDVLYGCIGALNDWKWPDIPGLFDFKGKLVHSAAWDAEWDVGGLSVAVIGAGSSAIQIVPAIQPKVKHLDNYVRGQTWIAPPVAEAEVRKHILTGSNFQYSPEELDEFNKNPDRLRECRKRLDGEVQLMTKFLLRGELSNQATATFTESMRKKLAKRPDIFEKILPSFAPGCRRFDQNNVSFVTDPIAKITEDGILTADGKLRKVDAIIYATGFDTSFSQQFPIYGSGNLDLGAKWKEYPETYLSLSTHGVPNYFVAHGPNSGVGTGSLVIVLERTCDYVAAVIAKLQRDRIATIQPKQDACMAFRGYCEKFFRKTRGTEDGPVTALWPGSCLHFVKILENPRFEDYEYTYIDGRDMAWMGNGFTTPELDASVPASTYLDPNTLTILQSQPFASGKPELRGNFPLPCSRLLQLYSAGL